MNDIETIQSDLDFLNGKRTVNKLREVYFKKNLYEYYIRINDYTKDYDMKFNQRVWHFYHQIPDEILYSKCIHCNTKLNAKFESFKTGYFLKKYCNSRCQLLSSEYKDKMKNIYIEKYGVESCNADPVIIQKKKDSYYNKTGYEHWQRDPKVREKTKNTCIERYGADSPLSSEKIKEKIKNTLLSKYGVDNSMKHYPSFVLNMSNGFKIHKYKNTELKYQSKLELKFIELYEQYFDLNDLTQNLIIKYDYDNQTRSYYPDFYIEKINTIIEIKSTWTYDKNGSDEYTRNKNIEKELQCNSLGYNFIMLIGITQINDYIQDLIFKQQSEL